MFVELPAFNPDRTSIEQRKVWVNPAQVAGIQKMNVNNSTGGIPVALGEAWSIILNGGSQILVDKDADLSPLIGEKVTVHGPRLAGVNGGSL